MTMMTNGRTDQRKHVVQMNRFEQDAVESFIHSVRGWSGLDKKHVTGRKQELWNVTDAEIILALRNGEVIEVHNNNAPEIRAVVRANIGHRSICVAISLTTKTVVTVWVNGLEDKHAGLRLHEYMWKANLKQVIAGFQSQL